MKDPLEDYNLDFVDYPDWKNGLIFGLLGGLVTMLCICAPMWFLASRMKDKSPLSSVIFAIGVFAFGFFIFGAYVAFRPPKN